MLTTPFVILLAVEHQLQEMTVMSATLDEIQKQHQAIKTRVFSPNNLDGSTCLSASSELTVDSSGQYEEEIRYLRMAIEAAGGQVQPRKESSSVLKIEAGAGSALAADLLGHRGNTSLLDLYAGGDSFGFLPSRSFLPCRRYLPWRTARSCRSGSSLGSLQCC